MNISKNMIVLICAAFGIALTSCDWHDNSTRDGGVFSPLAAYDSANNQYFVLYQRRLFGDGKPRQLYGRRLGANGSLNGAEFAISGDLGDRNPSCYAVQYDSRNQRFLVAWPASAHVYGQLVNADGTLFGASFSIADTASCPVLAFDSVQAKFFVAWPDTTSAIGVYSQVLNADGSPAGARNLLTNNVYLYSSGDGPVSAAFDADSGRFLVAIRDWQTLSTQAVNSDGTPTGSATTLSNTVDDGDRSVMAHDEVNKRYLVSWSDHDRLRGQLLNPDNTLQGSSFGMSGIIRWLWHHALAYDAAGQRFLEVYDNGQWWYDNQQVFGQMLNADGTLMTSAPGSQFLISPNDYPGANRPSVVFNSLDRKFLVVWEYDGQDARYPDIHARIMNADGGMDGDIFIAAVGGQ